MRRLAQIALAMCLLLVCGCSVGKATGKGTVTVYSQGVEQELIEHWVYGFHDGIIGDGPVIWVEEAGEQLLPIPYTDDLEVVITGKPRNNVSYVVYDHQYQQLLICKETLSIPKEPGIYLISFHLEWGTKKSYDGYQYYFKVEIPQ